MSLTLDLQFPVSEAQAAVAGTPKRVSRATRRALSRTATRMRQVVRAEASKQAGVPQRSMRGRVYSHLSRSSDAARIWVGVYRIGLSGLGRPRETKTGVRLGRRVFPGAFLGRGRLAGRGIFIRYHSPHFDPALYHVPTRSTARDPIARARGVPIQDEVEAVFSANRPGFEQFFAREFQAELSRIAGGA